MAYKTLSILFLLAATASISSAFNISNILDQYPDFSTFNTLLSQTGLAEQINSRSSITVLAVDNTVLRGFPDLPANVIKIVLSVHVILDYYDLAKIESLKGTSTVLTTLYQTTGQADQRMGFVNMTKGSSKDHVTFGSTMPGSMMQANLLKPVVAKPYNISVLQVDSLIVPSAVGAPAAAPEADANADATAAAANNSKAPSTTNQPAAKAPAATSTPAAAKAPATNVPPTKANTPSTEAPTADAPVATSTPATASPTASVPASDVPTADAPVLSKKAADAVKSGAGPVVVSAGAGVAILGSILLGL